MSDTTQQAFVVDPAVAAAAAAGQGSDFAGAEAPRAIQEQQARQAALIAASQQAAGQHPQQAVIDAEQLKNSLRTEISSQYHTQMEELRASIGSLQAERDAAVAAAEAEQQRLADEAKAADEEKMGAKAFAEAKTAELQTQLDQIRAEAAQREALFEKERQFMALQEYRANRLAQEDAQNIIPTFRDLVSGNTPEEIEASVADLLNRSTATVQQYQEELQRQRIVQPGVSTRAPGALSGPMEMADTTRQLDKKDIDAMDMATYARLRPQLLQARPQGF